MTLSQVVDGVTDLDSSLFNPIIDQINNAGSGIVNVLDYGAAGNGSTDDTQAIQDAIDAGWGVVFPIGSYKVTATLTITKSGVRFVGARGAGALVGGSQINFSGTGPLFQIGTDSGNAYDSNEYDGYEWTTFEGVSLRTSGGVTALANGTGNYKAGTYGIRDWRGGYIRMIDCELRGFEYGFWGIQSDVNRFDTVRIVGNKVGIYLGPRSDQLTAQHLYTFYNDTSLWFDRVWGARVIGLQSVGDGSDATPPIKIGSSWAEGSNGIVFDSPWLEHVQGETTAIDAFIQIGVGDSVASENIVIRNPTILTNATGEDHRVQHIVTVENGDYVSIEDMAGVSSAMDGAVHVIGTTSPRIRLQGSSGTSQELTVVDESDGSPEVYRERWSGRLAWSHGASDTSDDVCFVPSPTGSGIFMGVQNVSPSSTVHIQGSFAVQATAISADTLLTSGDATVLVDASGADRTITLQTASSMVGRIYTVKKTDSSGNGVIIDPYLSQTIDGATTKTITSQYGFLMIQSHGSNWHILSQGGTIS